MVSRNDSEFGPGKKIDDLLISLRNNDLGEREKASNTLANMGVQAILPLFEILRTAEQQDEQEMETEEVYEEIERILKRIGEPAYLFLVQKLSSKEYSERATAANSLGNFGDKRAVEALILLLEDEDCDVRGSAAWSLGKLNDERAVAPLIKIFSENNIETTGNELNTIALVLGKFGEIESLIEALDRNGYVSYAATEALRIYGDERVLAKLEIIQQNNSYLEDIAKQAISEIKKRNKATPPQATGY